MNYDNYYKNGGMTKEESVSAIALRIGAKKEAVAKFVEKNNIDTNKLNSDLKSGQVYFLDVITAIVGKPNNKYEKEIVKKYGNKMAMGGKTQGYDAREDERLGMEYGKMSGKDFDGSHAMREHSRRDDARFEERMAKGGEIAEYRVIPNKRGQGSLSHIVEADYKMAFTIKGSKQEAEMSAQSFVTENNETHPTATVTKIHPSGQPLKNKKVSYVTKNEISKFAEGGHIVEHDKMYNFLEDDLQSLQNAIEEGDFEEVNRFFSYWGQHLKSLETKTNERMYNFLEDDLKKLQTAIEEGDTEEVSKFFSYWNQHLQSLKMADGGMMADGNSVDGFSVGDRVIYKNGEYPFTIVELVDDENLPYAKIKNYNGKIKKAYLTDLTKVKLMVAKEYVNPELMNKMRERKMADSGETERKAEAIKTAVEIATMAYNNGVRAYDMDFEDFSYRIFSLSKTSYPIVDLRLAYNALIKAGYKNGGMMADGGEIPNTVSEFENKVSMYYAKMDEAEKNYMDDDGASYHKAIEDRDNYIFNTKKAWYENLSEAEKNGNSKRYEILLKMINDAGLNKYAKGGLLEEGDYVWNAVGKKLVVNKVTEDEYFLSAFGQIGDSPFSKQKVEMYLKNGQWSRKPKMAKGGAIENQYEGRTAKDIWESWNDEQKIHFFTDHKQHPYYNMGDEKFVVSKNDREKYVGMSYDDLPKTVKLMISDHVEEGEYAKGGAISEQNEMNKKVLALVQKANIDSKLEFGQLVVSALTDANAHSEVRKFISIIEKKPEWAEEPKDIDYNLPDEEFEKQRAKTVYGSKYYDADKKINDLAIKIANMFGWDFEGISDSLIFASKMSGRNDVAQVLEKLNTDDDKQDATKNKWDYTDVDEIEYVVVKDKSKKEIKFDGKDVISGVHDLLEKGGKLTEIGKYYSKNDVVSVFVNGKNILDKNTVSGVWIKKDAKPMAEDVAEMKIGKTTIRKGVNGWVAKTMVDNFKGFDWEITTIKNFKGDLVTIAQAGKSEDRGGYQSFTFMVFQDPSIRLKSSRPPRVTDKVVTAQHEEAMKDWKERQDEVAEMVDQIQSKRKMADGGAIGFDALAKKVAKNYEGDKVKKQYQDEYGKTYDKKEAEEVGKKVAGKVYGQQQAKKKMAKGGKVAKKSGSPANRSQSKMTLISRKASEIRKANEPWKDAFNRAKAIIG